MRDCTPAEIRFHIKRGLQSLPRSTLKDLAGSEDRRAAALNLAMEIIAGRFEGYEFRGPDAILPHGDGATYAAQQREAREAAMLKR